jgi:YVTN family beta-propeller protein
MEFRLLGPVEVDDEGRPLVLGGAKQRALLAILLLHANEVVSRDRLIDEIWGEHPPASAPHSLEVYVSRLRKTLHAGGEGQRLLTHAGGYLLQLEDEQLDVNRFARLVAEGRGALAAGDYDRAAGQLAEALAVWRGPALSDLAFESFARAEIDRLEEERLAALEDRIEAELALGRHGAVVGELETLSSRHPLRERLHAQLMLSLYRSGRQAEALAVYRRTRQHLMDELGIEPSPELQRLQQKILRQDPSLELSTTEPGPRPAEPGSPTRRLFPGRWRPAAIAVVIAGLLATAAAAAVALFTGSSEPSLHGVDANAVGVIDPDNGRITSEVRLDRTPSHLAAGAGSIWALSAKQESVSRIAAISGRVIQTIQVGHGPTDIAYGSRAVWVVNSLDGTVSRIDRDSNTVVDDIPVGNIPLAVATGFGSIWVTTAGDREVVRLDAHTGRVVKRIATGSVGRAIAVTDDAVWVSDDDHNRVSGIDPKSNEVTKSVTVGQGPTAVAYGAGALWVVNELDRTVMRIDPRENIVARTIPIGGTPTDLLFADGGLWVTDETGGRVVRVDPRRNEVGASIDTGNRPQGVAFAAGRLWLSVQPAAFSHRGGTLKVVSIGRTFDSLDPALGYDGEAWNLLGMLYDGLTSFQRIGNPEGTKLVPDLATSLPVPSDDGRTYIFQLR